MTNSMTLQQLKQSSNHVAQTLQDVLANTYGLYLATHNYHWNIEGRRFAELHTLFDKQYNELFEAIDGIAEHIRTLGEYALPFEGDNIVALLKMTSNALNKENDADARADRMLHNLVTLQESVIKSCQIAKKAAQAAEDDESENLLVERITAHQKMCWMLNSILK